MAKFDFLCVRMLPFLPCSFEEDCWYGKFKLLWMGPYIVKRVLAKGAYELMDYDGIPLVQPHNGLYVKRYYA